MKPKIAIHSRTPKCLIAVFMAAAIGSAAAQQSSEIDNVAARQGDSPITIVGANADQPYLNAREILEPRELVLEDTDYLWSTTTWQDFEAKARQLAEQSLRLVDVEINVIDDEVHYAGVWRSGSGSFALWTCPTLDEFNSTWQEFVVSGLQLIDIEVYRHQGKTWYFGLFREDINDGHYQLYKDWDESHL